MSTDSQPQNHYQVLGVDPSADERAIKKAYFALIRKFPPEKHPDDFRRIRESYEVLSDPEARKRYDGSQEKYDEHGPEIGAELREVIAAGRAGDEELARQKLTALLEKHPTVHTARHLLGMSHLRTKQFESARELYLQLSADLPDNPQYMLHLGYALDALERNDEALAAFQKAQAIKPADVAAVLALADALMAAKRTEDALQVLREGLGHHPELGPPRLILELRRIAIFGIVEDHAAMQEEATRLCAAARAAKDPDMLRYLSGELAAVAAKLFAEKHYPAANQLLTLCKELHPSSLVEHPWAVTALAVEDLPSHTRDWLADIKVVPNGPTLEHSAWGLPVAGVLGAALFLFLTLVILWEDPAPTSWEQIIWTLIGLGLAATLGMMAARSIYRTLTSGIGHHSTVTLLHLLSVTPSRVKVFPLFLLQEVSAVKHLTNGSYTHTQITVWFHKDEKFFLSLRDEAYATGWVNYLLQCHRRALELMAEGFLDAEPAAELFPPALLERPAVEPLLSRADRRWWAGAAAAAVAGLLITQIMNVFLIETADFAAAIRGATAESYKTYLQRHPRGRHVQAIRGIQTERFDAGLTALKNSCAEASVGCEALLAALRSVREDAEPRLGLALSTTLDGDGDALMRAAATKEADLAAAQELARHLKSTLRTAGMTAVEVTASADASSSAQLVVQRKLAVKGALRGMQKESAPSVVSTWNAILKSPSGAQAIPIGRRPRGPLQLRLPKDAAAPTLAEAAIRAQLQQDVEALADGLAEALGLQEAALLARLSVGTAAGAVSPY